MRGRLANMNPSGAKPSTETEPCRVSAELDEGGELRLSVTATGKYADGARVSTTFDGDDFSDALRERVSKALAAVLDDAHEELKESYKLERVQALKDHPQLSGIDEELSDDRG